MVPYSKIHSKVSLSHEIPPGWQAHAITASKALYGKAGTGEMLIQYQTYPEYSIYFARMKAMHRETIMLVREQPVFFLIVQLENTLNFSLPGMPGMRLLEWSFNFMYAPVFELEAIIKKGAAYETFFLVVPEAFVVYFAKQYHFLTEFLKNTKSKNPQSLLPHPKICPLPIIRSINAVQQQGMDSLDLPFAENLLSAIFESANCVPYRRMHYADEVIERLYALRAFLQEHMESNLTRKELMQRFHLSEQQFSKGFMSIYNLSPFSLLKVLKRQET